VLHGCASRVDIHIFDIYCSALHNGIFNDEQL